MSQTHAHDHAAPADLGPAFRWAVGLNAAYVIVEAARASLPATASRSRITIPSADPVGVEALMAQVDAFQPGHTFAKSARDIAL